MIIDHLMPQCSEGLTILIQESRVNADGNHLADFFFQRHSLELLIGPFDCFFRSLA